MSVRACRGADEQVVGGDIEGFGEAAPYSVGGRDDPAGTFDVMSLTVHLSGELAAALEAEAARRGQAPEQVAADLLAERLPAAPASDRVEAFIGSADSGDAGWAGRDTRQLRAGSSMASSLSPTGATLFRMHS